MPENRFLLIIRPAAGRHGREMSPRASLILRPHDFSDVYTTNGHDQAEMEVRSRPNRLAITA